MNRRTALKLGATAGTTLVAGCSFGYDGPDFDGGFESGIGDWERGAAIGPEVDVSEFDRELVVTDERPYSGERSLRVFTEGDYDDGTAWVSHPVAVPDGGPHRALVTAQFWSESESFNILRNAVARLATEPPETEADFPDPGVNTTEFPDAPYGGVREPLHLREGWYEYAFEWNVPADVDELVVSVGVSVVWEADATHFVDDVTVTFSPA